MFSCFLQNSRCLLLPIIGRLENFIFYILKRKIKFSKSLNMGSSEIIISGPKYSGPEYWGSIAECLIPKMKSQPKDFVLQVDCATDETITSHDFLRQSLEITEGLFQFGLKQGDVIIFACSNNIRSHIATIGIFLSGAIFAPIDRTLKASELQLFFKEFRPKYIICECVKKKEIQDCVKAVNIDCKIILIDSSDSCGEFFSWEDIRTKVDVDNYIPRKVNDPMKDVALIICSSGSTGMPKGVALSHYSILFNLSISESIFIPERNQNFLFLSPLFWISGILLILNSCFLGQTRYVPKSLASEDILKAIERGKPFFLVMGPALLISLVQHPDFNNYDLSSVKVVFSAGAPLNSAVAAKVLTIWNSIKIINCYGLTETCGGIAKGSSSGNGDAVGTLLPDIQVKLVDVDTGECVGPNKIGECRVKTKRMMLGYYNNKEATKAAFDENGWLRTGDLLYYDEEGVFYFVSRASEIIHYLNYKISPVELESFIISLPGVKDVLIVPVPQDFHRNHLKALVVKDPNFDISPEFIIKKVEENFTERKHLKEGVQFVDALPRSEVGKLKRWEAQKMFPVTKT